MAKKRLTIKKREEILSDAIKDMFEKRVKTLLKRSAFMSEKYYKKHFESDVNKIKELTLKNNWLVNSSNKIWFSIRDRSFCWKGAWRTDEEYQGYVKGQFYANAFCMDKYLPIPPSSSCYVTAEVGSIQEKQLLKLDDDVRELVKEENKLYQELRAFLYACKTEQDITDTWPEGERYLSPDEPKKNLPIPLVDNVRAAMQKYVK